MTTILRPGPRRFRRKICAISCNWHLDFSKKAAKELLSLDPMMRKHITNAIDKRLLVDPANQLEPLAGPLKGYHKFRVAPFRLICDKQDDRLVILVIKIAHYSAVYDH